jgi:predicted esterase
MENKISVNKTFRYHTFGNPEKASHIWIVLHGYGQLAFYFLRKFNILDPEKHFIVAPEGMHRFYLKGTSGRVGASWMTKEARLDDINDNHHFLDALTAELLAKYTFEERTILGFSQGGATASRWHQLNTFKADNFVLWACVFPPDLEASYDDDVFISTKNYFVIGTEDEYFQEKLDEVIENYQNNIPGIKTITFKGSHTIKSEALRELEEAIETT